MHSQKTLTDKQVKALALRREGKKLSEIGDALDVSPDRARKLIERARLIESRAWWADGLPSRYALALVSRGIDSLTELRAAIDDGSLRRMPGIGPKCYATITEWIQRK